MLSTSIRVHSGHSLVYSATFSGKFEGGILVGVRGYSGGAFGVNLEVFLGPLERKNLQNPIAKTT